MLLSLFCCHLSPDVREHQKIGRRDLHNTTVPLDPVVRGHENAARRDRHLSLDVWEHENVARWDYLSCFLRFLLWVEPK